MAKRRAESGKRKWGDDWFPMTTDYSLSLWERGRRRGHAIHQTKVTKVLSVLLVVSLGCYRILRVE